MLKRALTVLALVPSVLFVRLDGSWASSLLEVNYRNLVSRADLQVLKFNPRNGGRIVLVCPDTDPQQFNRVVSESVSQLSAPTE